MINFLSLFSCIGGLDRGLELAGLRCIAQVEIDPWCRRILSQHWPNIPKYDDVIKFCRRLYDCDPEGEDGEANCPRCNEDFSRCACIGTDQFIDECGVPDLIAGGDPCQRNANCWRHGGGSPSLGYEFIRIVAELRPRFVLRENPSVTRADAPWPWQRFRGELERLGYAVLPFRLRACCVGADHRRERLFLLAALPDSNPARLQGNVSEIMARADRWRCNADAARSNRWHPASRICRGVDGISHRVDRLKGLGNAVDIRVGHFIGSLLMNAAGEAA
jgi:DNA (cytosine-5)-methyltransferase 1